MNLELFKTACDYLPIISGCLAQIVFLFIPISISHWAENTIVVVTYSGIQTFMGGLFFVALPIWTGLPPLTNSAAFFVLIAIFLASSARALKLVHGNQSPAVANPLSAAVRPLTLELEDFLTDQRQRRLSEISSNEITGQLAFEGIRERLVKRKPEKSDKSLYLGKSAQPE